jgi:hypothetical protein
MQKISVDRELHICSVIACNAPRRAHPAGGRDALGSQANGVNAVPCQSIVQVSSR